MTAQESSDKKLASGYFKATQNDEPFFLSDRVEIGYNGELIEITGSLNAGFPDGRLFILTINKNTSSGEQTYTSGDRNGLYNVEYISAGPTAMASSGQFNAILNNITKKFHITFQLRFTANVGEIKGELEIEDKS